MDKLYYHIKESTNIDNLPAIKGPNLESDSLQDVLTSFASMGLQASELARAIDVGHMMVRENIPIYLSFTSNMVSSGVREIITYLVKHKKVAVLCTSAGGIEEDGLKARKPFRLGHFVSNGASLFEKGIGRIGNMYATNEHYSYFEEFMRIVFDALPRPCTPSQIANEIGRQLELHPDYNHEESYLYWAYKNDIPVYCPSIIDGAIGDFSYFYKQTHPDFSIDVVSDHKKIIDYTLQQERTAGICLGGGVSKHYILNANIFKEGFDYTVYISTAQSFDGSDSGGNQEEAITWAKIKVHSPRVKAYCDASIAFPLFAYSVFRE